MRLIRKKIQINRNTYLKVWHLVPSLWIKTFYFLPIDSCRLYSKFLKKTGQGVECVFCNHKLVSTKSNTYAHIRRHHSNEEEFKKHKKNLENSGEFKMNKDQNMYKSDRSDNSNSDDTSSGDDQSIGKSIL